MKKIAIVGFHIPLLSEIVGKIQHLPDVELVVVDIKEEQKEKIKTLEIPIKMVERYDESFHKKKLHPKHQRNNKFRR